MRGGATWQSVYRLQQPSIQFIRLSTVKSSCKWSLAKLGLSLYEYKAAFFCAGDRVIEKPSFLLVATSNGRWP